MEWVSKKLYAKTPIAVEDSGDSLFIQDFCAFKKEFCRHVGEAASPEILVFIFCENTLGALAGYLACLENKIVPLLLDAAIEPEVLKKLCEAYRPHFFWAPSKKFENAVFEFRGYALLKKYAGTLAMDERLALLLQTSGTTGEAKTVRLSAENLRDNACAIAGTLGIDARERPLLALPLNYSYGISIVNSHVISGATILLSRHAIVQKELWDFAREQGATSFSGVPYTYEVLDRLRIFAQNLPTLKTWTQAGGKLAPALVEKLAGTCRAHGQKFFVMYGQTEASPRISVLASEFACEKPASIGKPIGTGTLEIDAEGELVFRGKNVALGYATCAGDLARGDDFAGTLRTGDLARCDADGFFYITGRKARFAKIFGKRVDLDSLKMLAQSSALGECACVCDGNEKTISVFVENPDTDFHATVREKLAEKTKLNPSVFAVKFIEKLPRNAFGKIRYAQLGAMKFSKIVDVPATFEKRMQVLTCRHVENCAPYRAMMRGEKNLESRSVPEIPFLPARLFKEMELKSVPESEIVRVLTSSGTSNSVPAKIFLDAKTATAQSRALAKIVEDFLGIKRVPMLILDSAETLRNRTKFSARAAAILGFSLFGTERAYALDAAMQPDSGTLLQFSKKHAGSKVLLFGFTAIVWEKFFDGLEKSGMFLDFSNAILLHGGGWKKLERKGIFAEAFKARAKKLCGIEPKNVRDYYGMAEQTGSIFMECECGHLHVSEFSEILIRRAEDFSLAAPRERGIVEVLSSLPESYPGHAILTEDTGTILGENDCPCGRAGKYFKIFGRLKSEELRGCSDVGEIARREDSEPPAKSESQNFAQNQISAKQPASSVVAGVPVFSAGTIDFLAALSGALLKNPAAVKFPDLAAFGFFCRRANLLAQKERYAYAGTRVGRGEIFHIAPANVPLNFAYSLAAGLLAGNANCVRLSSSEFPQVEIFERVLGEVLRDFPEMERRIKLVRYAREDVSATVAFSKKCDARVIWGGDETIAEIQKIPLAPEKPDIAFGDRFSLAALSADAVAGEKNLRALAEKFYNDTFLFDQNACTSPQLILWLAGTENVSAAREKFWAELYALARKRYALAPVLSVAKLATFYRQAVAMPVRRCAMPDNWIVRVEAEKLVSGMENFRCAGGYFTECVVDSLAELVPVISPKMQTLAQFGVDEAELKKLAGTPLRIVPVGTTLDFALTWDGVDLISGLSRECA